MLRLRDQITKFKVWAANTSMQSGEWECNYDYWHDLWAATEDAINSHQDGLISDKESDDFLYVLGRDNECEYIRRKLLPYPKLIATLAHRATNSNDADAKWQIAVTAAESQLPDTADLLRPFLSDSNEYVRRRTLMAYAPFAPKQAESIAIENLEDDYEYTRIAALHVLHTIGSSYLSESLDRLASDPNVHVRKNVQDLRTSS